MALEFVAQESLGRTRNPDCEREEALGKVLPEIGAKPGDVRGDLCPNDTLCVQLQLGKNKLFDTCARPVAKDIFVSCPLLICSKQF